MGFKAKFQPATREHKIACARASPLHVFARSEIIHIIVYISPTYLVDVCTDKNGWKKNEEEKGDEAKAGGARLCVRTALQDVW